MATTVATAPEVEALTMLAPHERDYVKQLKRKQRTDVIKFLDVNEAKRRRDGSNAPLRIQVLQSSLPNDTRMRIFNELSSDGTPKYIQWVRKVLLLPISRIVIPRFMLRNFAATPTEAIRRARETMDEHVTGHDVAKREILKLVCQARCGGACASSYAIGFEGPPGAGKTHFVKHAVAAALERPFVSIPLGGANDLSYLLGNVYTYEGSKEGRLASALIESECSNPIVYFDELDKISSTERGQEIVNVLIHLIDPTANSKLRDRYFHGIDLDFSKCTFFFSYNDASRVSPILLDRIKRVHMPSPNEDERVHIVAKHLVPRAQNRLNCNLNLSEDAMRTMLQKRYEQGGMRACERDVDHVLAEAQICIMCGTDANDGALAGIPGVRVLDEDGCVSDEFVTGCFAKQVATGLHDANVIAPPTQGLYL